MVPYLIEGVVVDTADPQEMGRLRIWCPAVDGDNAEIETLPWALYISPLAGQAYDYPAGSSEGKATGPVSYGMWAIPKIGAQVVVSFLYGDYNQRVYMGSYFRDHGNRSLPAGRNSEGAPVSDTFEDIEPTKTNLTTQFQGKLTSSVARTRGAYERQVAQAADSKTSDEGYSVRVVDPKEPAVGDLDPQTYSITTPGRHAIIMQDDPKHSRIRFKTAEGHQIIFDDANERIYVSTAHGKSWYEMDLDGHVHVYGAKSISMSAGVDINLSALGDINLQAGKNVNISASAGYARLSACQDVSLNGATGVNISSGAEFNILASASLTVTGSTIHLNGPPATEAACASTPKIVPAHEPWSRPAGSKRGPHWKE